MCKRNRQKLVRIMLDEEHAKNPDFYSDNFTAKQRKDLIHTTNETMWDEIAMLRTAIKQYYSLVNKKVTSENPYRFADALQLLGLSSTRLARVMQINKALGDGKSDAMDGEINTALEALMGEYNNEVPGVTTLP